MDEKTAWKNFASTGSVSDYLKYCQAKNQTEQNNQFQNISSEGSYDNYRGTDTQRTECR